MLKIWQLQAEKGRCELASFKLESLQNALGKTEKLTRQEQAVVLDLQLEHTCFSVQQAKASLQQVAASDITKSTPAYVGWEHAMDDLVELYTLNSLLQNKAEHYHGEMQHKLKLCVRKNEALGQLVKAEVEEYEKLIVWGIWISLAGILLSIFQLYTFLTRELYKPLQKLISQTSHMMENAGRDIEDYDAQYLFRPLVANIRQYNEQIGEITKVSDLIGEGNFEQDLSFRELRGALGNSILQMQKKIQKNFEEEKKTNWTSNGIEYFSRVLREGNTGIDHLCKKFISALVPFIEANQGAVFLQKEDDSIYELKAAYAWGKQKYLKKSCVPGEGLIGQAILDAETIYIDDVPENFIEIGSGLGKAKPSCVVLVPLKFNNAIYGVLELATLKKLKNYQITFLEKLAEIFAATLANTINSQHTKKLLEESQRIAEQLKIKEEELRNNSLELEAAGEHLSRRLEEATHEMELRIKEIELEKRKNMAILEGCVDGVVTFNQSGKIEFFNKAAEEIWNIDRSQMIGRPIQELIPIEFLKENGTIKPYYMRDGQMKPIDIRTEVAITDPYDDEVSVLLTLSDACIGNIANYALFIQRISVELF